MTIFESIVSTVSEKSLDVAVWALVVTLVITILSARKANRVEREENYIQLELASNELFRFEADHAAQLEPFQLNLFEIAVRLREQDRFGKIAFGTWVVWFYDTLNEWFFREEWPTLRENYTVELRGIFDEMLEQFDTSEDPEIRKDKFFAHVATKLDCSIVRAWRNDLNLKKTEIPRAIEAVDVKLATTDADRNSIVELMATTIHSQQSYISHSDYFAGRSVDGKSFVPNLENIISAEMMSSDDNIEYAMACSKSGQIVGCVAYYFSNNGFNDYCILDDIVVLSSSRSKGTGKALFDHVLAMAKERRAKKIMLESGVDNHTAHRFFERQGFKTMSKTFYLDI